MKIVIINGSPKSKGNSSQIVETLVEEFSQESLSVNTYYLEGIQYKSCKGCDACFKNGVCHLNDGFKEIYEDIRTAEGVIFVSPTYVSNVPGVLKMFIDRSNFVMGQYLTNKRIINIVTYRNAQGKAVKRILDRFALFSGGIVLDGLVLKIANRMNEDHLGQVRRIAASYLRNIRAHKPKGLFNQLIHLIVFKVGIKPEVIKNKEDYAGIINEWKQMGII